VEIEITPEPSDEERAAILAALAAEREKPAPEPPWIEETAPNP
jgi:hypothetical protein